MISQSPALILLFNHWLTEIQEADARKSMGIKRIVEPPAHIGLLWAQVPPDIEDIGPYLAPVFDWLSEAAQPGDFVLLQGEFGATWLAVKEAFRLGLVPVSSTTRREVVEEHLADGRVEIRHVFSHVRYRRYTP
jgi:hypothetical protein